MRRQEEETTINIKEDAAPTSCWAADITKDYKENAASGSSAIAGGAGRSLKCIFKWPHDLEKLLGEDIYREPQMVAIGPYHHGRPHLQPMERHKKNALFRILQLSGGLPVSIFVEPLKQVEQELRNHYDELDPSCQQADKQSTSNMDFALEFLPKIEKYVRSATKLRAAGVSFQKCPKDAGLLSVRFRRSCLRGVLHLPELVLDETTEGVFMNMVAFERMHPESGTEVTSFLSFMDALIDTADDVSFLSNEGIVKNSLGSDKAAAKIFNKLGIHGMCNPFDEIQQEVQKYASPYMQEWWAHFKRTHFTSPWTVLSFIGALFFILITIVQTAYTVLPYYKRRG
ncbi:hypothetical protein EJ110_NYTH46904 [Nymphaea thermarum]|nr:hypothetical protein EJ110_NYTH46904 [Nymphaea thermarum]